MRKATTTFVAAVSAMLFAVGIAAAQHTFSNADFDGTYILYFHGTDDGTGVLSVDGKGNLASGNETVSDGANVCAGSLSGTYSVNADGTGAMTAMFTPTATIAGTCPSSPVTYHSALVMTSRRYLNTVSTDAGILVLGHLTRQHRDNAMGE